MMTLTPQQVRVLMMLSEGLLNKQIAYELKVVVGSVVTVTVGPPNTTDKVTAS